MINYTLISGGSRISHWGDTEPLGALTSDMGTFQQKMYATTKELDSIGGGTHEWCPWIRQCL